MSTTDDRITITLALTQDELDALRWALQEQRINCENTASVCGISDEGRAVFAHRARQLGMLNSLVYCMAIDYELAHL